MSREHGMKVKEKIRRSEMQVSHAQGQHSGGESVSFTGLRKVHEMRVLLTQACSLLSEGKFERACCFFDELHRRAGDVHEFSTRHEYGIAKAAIKSLQRVIEGMIDPSTDTIKAISGHLNILDKVFRDDMHSIENERGRNLNHVMNLLRSLSVEESRRAYSDLRKTQVKVSS